MTLEEYDKFFAELKMLTVNAGAIASAIEGRPCTFEGFDDDGYVTYTYHDGCNCHGDTVTGRFAPEHLFNPEYLKAIVAMREAKEKAAKEAEQKAEEAHKAAREAEERKMYEALKAKYDRK